VSISSISKSPFGRNRVSTRFDD